jgi:hypothetical protein
MLLWLEICECYCCALCSANVHKLSEVDHPRCLLLRSGLDEKRVHNKRIKLDLGVTLAFPSYREGLRAIHNGDMRPFDLSAPYSDSVAFL